jgi:hypothetical protein
VFLKLPEVRGLERTRIAKSHEAVHPAKRYQVEPISTHFPDVFGIFYSPFGRWWVGYDKTLDEAK